MRAACGPTGSIADCTPPRHAASDSRTSTAPALLRALLAAARVHVVVARGRHVLRQLPAHRADVADQLPDLRVRHLLPERGHAVRPPLDDGLEDVRRVAAVDPLLVLQRRADAAAA